MKRSGVGTGRGLGMLAALAGILVWTAAATASPGNQWSVAGGDLQNTRSQSSETKLGPANAAGLAVKWSFTTAGDVSATPSVDGDTVYFPDWTGNLYAVDKRTGALKWTASIPAASGILSDRARDTPAVTDSLVIVGTQGSIVSRAFGCPTFVCGPGGKVLAFNKFTGALVWSTQADSHLSAIITQSPTVFDGKVFVGVASQDEALSAHGIDPTYVCCTFRGSMLALDLATGAILWKTYTVPAGYSGGAVWGSSPAIDTKRGQVYIATGNNYTVPPDALACVASHPSDAIAQHACLSPDDHFDSIVALDMKTGAVRWATSAIGYDAWTVDCLPFFGGGNNCPSPAGPDYDFGQAPALFKATDANGKSTELVGAGQKSGQYWALDPDTGAVQWMTQAGPGGTAGGLQWGSAVDGKRVYTADANSDLVPWPAAGDPTTGVWSGLDAATGQLLWQTRPPHGGGTSGPVTTANGVVFGCSLDPRGWMYALDAASGAVLWSFESGGSCLSGAAISNGTLYWGSGYSNFGFGTPNNKLYAFGLPG